MKYGAINIVTDSGHGLPADPAPLERREEGKALRSTIELENEHPQATLSDITVENGELEATTIAEGKVLREELTEMKTRRVNKEGNLEVKEEGKEVRPKETRFIHVKDEILLTQMTEADEARNIIEEFTSSNIKEAMIEIPAFADAHPEADSALEWGRGENGKLCAVEEMSSDEDIRKHLDTSQRAQLSFKNLKWEGRRLYGTVTRSGYVQLYRDDNGGEVGTEEFTRFVLEEVIEHATISDS